MDRYGSLQTNDLMSSNIYSFLNSLMAAVRISETIAAEAQERDQIDIPDDIKPGGYSYDMFIFLSEKEKEEYSCSVCYSVIKDLHQCSNGHRFCYSCIYVWSRCNRAGADYCPACRCDGIYARNDQLNEKIGNKRVKCQNDGCNWRGFLRNYNEHEHRHYKFKELSRSIDLPRLKVKEAFGIILSQPVSPSESAVEDEYFNDVSLNNSDAKIDMDQFNADANAINSDSQNSVPRQLSRLPEEFENNERISDLRYNANNFERTENILTNYPLQVSRVRRRNRTSILDSQTNNNSGSVIRREFSESLQYLNSENIDVIYNTESDETFSSPTIMSHTRNVHYPLFSSPYRNNRHNSTTRELQRMEYRRLTPTYASRRSNLRFMEDDGEHLALLLILLTSDIEDLSSQSDSRNHLPATTRSLSLSLESSYNSRSQERITMSHNISGNRSPLQNNENLNNRISELENTDFSLDNTMLLSDRVVASMNFISGDNDISSDTRSAE